MRSVGKSTPSIAQPTLVALGEVDDDLRLGEHLHGVGYRSDALDRVGQLADVVAGDAADDRPADQHQPDGDRQAGHGELDVDVEPPATSNGRRLHAPGRHRSGRGRHAFPATQAVALTRSLALDARRRSHRRTTFNAGNLLRRDGRQLVPIDDP